MQIRKDIILEGAKSKCVNALIDTGASITLLPKKLADEIGARYTGEKQPLSGIFDNSGDVGEVAIINVKFPFLNNLNYLARVAVSAKATDVLIGLDVLNPLKMTIDTDTHELSVKNEVVEFGKASLMIVGGVVVAGLILDFLFGKKK